MAEGSGSQAIMTLIMNNPKVFLAGAIVGAIAKWALIDRNKNQGMGMP